MNLNRILLTGIFLGLALTSCRESNEAGRGFEVDESVEADRVEVEGEMEEENSVSVLIRRNGNLTTFAENLEKNQFQQNWGKTAGQGTMTGQENVTGEGVPASSESENMTGERTSDDQMQSQQTGQNGISLDQGYTIFAPSDDAFDVLSNDEKSAILDTNNREANLASINYLMVDQRLPQDKLKQLIIDSNGTYSLRTMQGENIIATLNGEIIVLKDAKGNEARVIEANDQAKDGVLYIIDGVLLPGDLTRNEAVTGDKRE